MLESLFWWRTLILGDYNPDIYYLFWFDLGGNDTVITEQEIIENKKWIDEISKKSK